MREKNKSEQKGAMALVINLLVLSYFQVFPSSIPLALFPVLKVYVFKVAVTAISVVAVAGADQMWQAGAGVVLSLPGERKLQRSQNTQITLLITT